MKHEKYFTPTQHGTRASIRIDKKLYQKHFSRDTDPVTMRQWIVDTEIAHRTNGHQHGSFRADAIRYLQAVASMTTFSDRKRDIEAWIGVFGDKARQLIAATEIAAALQTWRLTLSASSCNSRRAALQHLWTRLDGKGARNPVRDVPKFPTPSPAPQALDYSTIRKILKQIPKGPELAWLMMIAYVGLPNAIIGQLSEPALRRAIVTRELAVPGRKKGAGTPGRMLPLTPGGMRAVKMMLATKAWVEPKDPKHPEKPGREPIPRFRLRRVFHDACDAADVKRAKPYVLRHSFGTRVYLKSGDLDAVKDLMLHASTAMTQRYALGAVPDRLRKALKGFGR